MTSSLRRARPEDAAALAAILSDWIDATPWMPRLHSRDEDRAFVAELIARCDVTLAGEVPCGFVARDGDEIPALYVAAFARGRGIGRRLLDRAKATRRRLSLWTFQANTGARRFYARAGFREIERTDGAGNDERLRDVRLEWRAQ